MEGARDTVDSTGNVSRRKFAGKSSRTRKITKRLPNGNRLPLCMVFRPCLLRQHEKSKNSLDMDGFEQSRYRWLVSDPAYLTKRTVKVASEELPAVNSQSFPGVPK